MVAAPSGEGRILSGRVGHVVCRVWAVGVALPLCVPREADRLRWVDFGRREGGQFISRNLVTEGLGLDAAAFISAKEGRVEMRVFNPDSCGVVGC